MEQRLEFLQHSAYPAGRVQIFHVMLAGGLEVHEDRRGIAQRIQMMQVEGQSQPSRNRRQVNDAVCGSTDGQKHPDRIFKRFSGHDLVWHAIGLRQADSLGAR